MVDFINEVEEELRKDDYNKLLKRYGPLIAAVIAAIVLGTAFLEWREYDADRQARATSASYTEAGRLASAGEADKAVAQYIALAEAAPQGYAGLSLMRAAVTKQESGDRANAVTLYDRAAEKFDAPRHKQLAQLKAAYILAGDGAYQDVMSRAEPLAAEGAPYEFLARELMGFAAQKAGNDAIAREQFGYLVNIPGVPATVKQRAEQSLSLMGAAKTLTSQTGPQEGNDIQAPEPITPEDSAPDSQELDSQEGAPNE